MSYTVYYHVGDEMDLNSEVHRASLRIEEDGIVIEGAGPGFECSYRDVIGPPQYFRLHFLCRMLEIVTRRGRVFLTVPLVDLMNRPVVTNFLRLQALRSELDPPVREAWIEESTFQAS